MTTKWLSASLPAGTATHGSGNHPAAVGGSDGPAASTALANFDTAGASIVAITGDTYSSVTHQFTTGGATGITHAQWVTQAGLLNTALANLKTTAAVEAPSNGVLFAYDGALNTNQVKSALRAIIASLGN